MQLKGNCKQLISEPLNPENHGFKDFKFINFSFYNVFIKRYNHIPILQMKSLSNLPKTSQLIRDKTKSSNSQWSEFRGSACQPYPISNYYSIKILMILAWLKCVWEYFIQKLKLIILFRKLKWTFTMKISFSFY